MKDKLFIDGFYSKFCPGDFVYMVDEEITGIVYEILMVYYAVGKRFGGYYYTIVDISGSNADVSEWVEEALLLPCTIQEEDEE